MRASKSFSWPDLGILRVTHSRRTAHTPEMTTAMRALVVHLALTGPVLAGQAARWLSAGDPARIRSATIQVETAIRAGWLQRADWVPAIPETGILIPQPQRMVGLSAEAVQSGGMAQTWRWSPHMVCRAAPLAQLLLRFPPHMRDWRPLREEPRSHVVGWIRVSERTALILVLRKTKKPAEESDAAIAAVKRAATAIERSQLRMDRLWVIVPDESPEDTTLASEVAAAAGVLDRALLTTDGKLWDWGIPLHQAFSTWNADRSAWVPVGTVAALRDLEPAAAAVAAAPPA